MSNTDIAKGVRELATSLHTGKFTDISGAEKEVAGDFTKLRHVQNLSLSAQKVLSNLEARTRNIPGTREVRKTMRMQTHATQVVYGTSIFLTFSPSERDSALMLRLARVRQIDPALLHDDSKPFQGRDKPSLDLDFVRLDPAALASAPWHRRSLFCFPLAGRSVAKVCKRQGK